MAFLLYQTTKRDDGTLIYRQLKNVSLAGGGLIYSACKKHFSGKDGGWTITDRDMLIAGNYDPATHEVVVDVAPNGDAEVNLFEIKSISGYSYENWTPLMLTFEQLFSKAVSPSEAKEIMQEFTDDQCERGIVREFLYLTGGYARGNWNWGGNSRTTAALLWEDAWNYFQQKLRRQQGAAREAGRVKPISSTTSRKSLASLEENR